MTSTELLEAISLVGRENPSRPPLHQLEIFRHYFDDETLLIEALDQRDGSCTVRELLLRFLLLDAVLDQGPDSEGVGLLLTRVTNELYRNEVRFLHLPSQFFRELGIAIDNITTTHELIKQQRAQDWAIANESQASKYNLFLEGTKQVLSYAVFRWGVPLAVPLLLTRDEKDEERKGTALLRYLESWRSAEVMSWRLKDHSRYGLGKAIGDKATHLFAKWMIHSYLLTTKTEDAAWSPFSFEVPFDSNAGRVLFRTGFFLEWASLEEYEHDKWDVIRIGKGKGGTHYIRVTNIRGKRSKRAEQDDALVYAYQELCTTYLRTHQRPPQAVYIQRIPLAILLQNQLFTPGELDDGLMYIGTNFCFNHANPLCEQCPVNRLCRGYGQDESLITDYRT